MSWVTSALNELMSVSRDSSRAVSCSWAELDSECPNAKKVDRVARATGSRCMLEVSGKNQSRCGGGAMTSREPLLFISDTTPAASMDSIMRAARL